MTEPWKLLPASVAERRRLWMRSRGAPVWTAAEQPRLTGTASSDRRHRATLNKTVSTRQTAGCDADVPATPPVTTLNKTDRLNTETTSAT